jgi:hypothetical protein
MVVYGTGGVESCMVMRCEVVYGGDGVESCMVREVRCRVWDTCMEQRVPCMEHVVPALYETGGRIVYGCEM